MAMNRNMTMAEKEVRDYAQRQMERAEQRENIVFTEKQKEQVLEYAAMTGDDYKIRKMVRDLADAVRSSDEENPNMVLTKEQILDKLWDCEGNYIDSSTLTVYMRRLRMKIEDNPSEPQMLLTVRRMGYKWNVID